MRNEIIKLFPKIMDIKDISLREKTIECWKKAIEMSPFSLEDLDKIPFTLLLDKTDISLLKHTNAVVNTSIKIAESFIENYGDKMPIRMDYVISGAILHDVGKVLEFEKDKDGKVVKSHYGKRLRHPVSGGIIASEVGLPLEVVHIIVAHSKEGDFTKRSTESWIIHHADFVNFEPFKG